MNFDENKTDTFELEKDDTGSTESIQLNSEAVKPTAGFDLNVQGAVNDAAAGEHMIGAVINGYTVTSILSAATGEAEIFLGKKGEDTVVIKYYHSNMKPKVEILEKIRNLDHPDIIRLYEYGEFRNRSYEIMEYAPGGTLADLGPDGKYKYLPMTEPMVVKVIAETVNAFHYFHEKGIIHRDIKPLNIFCRSIDDMNIIIGDFGISSDLDVDGGMSKKMTSTGSRTTGYAAPELYGVAKDDNKSKILIGPEVDYYALGITVFELLTGLNIFSGRSELHIMRDTIQGRIIEDILTRSEAKNISPRMKKLIQGLLTVRHDKRWGFREVGDWLAGKDVPVFENAPLRDFEPLKFGSRSLMSMEEIVAAIDSDRDTAKKILMRAELEKWAARSGFDRLSDEITAIRESEMKDDQKVSTLLYLLEPALPCRIDGKKTVKTIDEFIDLLRKEPETMAALILEERKSDIYPWFNTIDKEITPLIRKHAANFRREGNQSKRLSVVSNIYLSFAGGKIKPFPDDDYEVSGVDDIINMPSGYRKKVISELANRNSILYIWLSEHKARGTFGMDWDSMDKTWSNLTEILSGNIDTIRERKIKEALRQPKRLRMIVIITGTASLLSIAAVLFVLIMAMFSFYSFPRFSPLSQPPVPQKWAYIYETESATSKRTPVNGSLVLLEPVFSQADVNMLKDQDMISVSYYSDGAGKQGFMRRKDLDITFYSYDLLFFFIPAVLLCLYSMAALLTVFFKNKPENFYYNNKPAVTAAGIVSTAGVSSLFMVPLFICYDRWKDARVKSDKAISFIKSGKFTSGGSGGDRIVENYANGDKYFGQFKDGKRHGHGIYTFSDGDKYSGEWKDNVMHGRGVYTYEDGSKYDGEWRGNEMHGSGVFHYSDGGVYEGGFKEGKADGTCVMKYADGSRYEGEVRHGEKNGHGKLTYADGTVKNGEWKDGEFVGGPGTGPSTSREK